MTRTVALLAMSWCLVSYAGEATSESEDLKRSIQDEITRLEAELPSEAEVRAALDPAEAARIRDAVVKHADGGADDQFIRAMLMDMNRKTLGEDAIQTALTQAMAPGGGLDPNAAMTYASGPQGLLWVFWSFDAPGIEVLPAQINGAQAMLPELVVRDSHVMPLSKWHALLRRLSDLKDDLERITPGEPSEIAIHRKKAQRDAIMPPLNAATLMSRTRRRGGYLLIEDQAPGLAYHITDVPMLVYVSPLGLVHRTKGLNPKRTIAEWIVQTQTWERENQAVLKARGFLK